MAKTKISFFCKECGNEYSKWQGKCTACGAWDSIVEHKDHPTKSVSFSRSGKEVIAPVTLSSITETEESRLDLLNTEFNRVLGGGIVKGSLVLLGGEPGIGKSTLVLQTMLSLTDKKVLYVSGEESLNQIKMRANRIGETLSDCYLMCDTSLENIMTTAYDLSPELLIVDSIQTVSSDNSDYSVSGVSQIRECASKFLRFAKESNIPIILIGHINKEGTIAGPKLLEHIVDVVLQFEGDNQNLFRILRAKKNRFGSTSEIGIFEMNKTGLREIANPSELLISSDNTELSGRSIAVAIEGIRPLLIETQALVSSSIYATPQRSATGFDLRRMNMLLAVLEKRVGFKLIQKDVFLNIAGGIKVVDTAIDLSVLASVLSSNLDTAIDADWCMTGEVGLSGEIRPVNRVEQRIYEAQKIGYKHIIIPRSNEKGLSTKDYSIQIHFASRVEEAFSLLFG